MVGDWEGPLDDLRYHWGEAYRVDHLGGRFVAQRRDSHATMSAENAEELLTLIREDYAQHPVPRDPRPCRLLPERLPSPHGAVPPGAAW
jgi:hypothetical protein